MTIKLNRALLTFGAVAVLTAPSAAMAHGGSSGSGRGSDGQTQTGTEHSTLSAVGESHSGGPGSGAAGTNASGSGRSGGDDSNRIERIDLRGTVVSVDPAANTIVVAVTKANHGRRGRAHVGQTITFNVSGAGLEVRDVNGDGTRDLNDIAAGDAVEVRAELPRSGTIDLTTPVVAQRLKDRSNRHANHDAQQPSDSANHR